MDVLHMAVSALGIIMDPSRIGFLFIGVLIGLVVGVVPGLGGVVGLSLLLPFTFTMDSYSAFAMMMGLLAVCVTSDTIPAVLFGVPGTVGSAATVLDGHPMARNGEAGRAFGAAFTASMLGGLFGAVVLGLAAPVLRPLILYIGSPELLSICLFGLSLVAILSGSSPAKGVVAVCIGFLLASIGDEPNSGMMRFTFNTLYLWDGLPLVPLALGLFAIPEIADLVVQRSSVAGSSKAKGNDQLKGAKDVFANWFLMLRCSAIGAALGAVPGVGASIIDWIAYGHAAKTEKGAAETFGKGDVRGVIASESSNNAKEGGTLIPTIAFGVPGSAPMALLLGAFLIHGLVPGPKMLTERLDVTYTLVWSVAIANVIGAGICFMFASQLAKLATVRIGVLAPLILSVIFVGAFQGSQSYGDLWTLVAFGLLGWIMKRLRWPRPPLLLGFVLGALVEKYLSISVMRYGWDWLTNPVVMVFLALTAYGLIRPAIASTRARLARRGGLTRPGFSLRAAGADGLFALVLAACFAAAFAVAQQWPATARLMPQLACCLAFAMIALLLASKVLRSPGGAAVGAGGSHFDLTSEFTDIDDREVLRRSGIYFLWILMLFGMIFVFGMLSAIALFMLTYLVFSSEERWRISFLVTAGALAAYYGMFHILLNTPWPTSVIGQIFPALKTSAYFNLF
ncbi:tripartite tricarboxylate transporter permease [Nitratireductor soli]|uniref:tripartite tricarboxylate transporter permease n=1 Tax=Nitratireductor soli TaxID=1670619 RepID=UPI00065E47BD|nr:tripartite tricarboxylate transporter permease [Nitratireductor soli]